MNVIIFTLVQQLVLFQIKKIISGITENYYWFFVNAVMPDFSQVYGFIGSVFDPTATNHVQRLRKMEPINVETVS